MKRIRLIHWNLREAKERAGCLKKMGFAVVYDLPEGPVFLRELSKTPPDAVVIDLSRLPSQGRDMTLAIRHQKATRYIPLVFVEGEPEKVDRIKEHLPDVIYTTWNRIGSALKSAMAHPPAVSVVPRSVFEGYSNTPLFKKLGIKTHSKVVLIHAPAGFEKSLGKLPDGVKLSKINRGPRNLTIWFAKSSKELEGHIKPVAGSIENGSLWIVWAKKTSRLISDLTQNNVRKAGLAAGLVDYKICSIDQTWSGLLFTRRKSR